MKIQFSRKIILGIIFFLLLIILVAATFPLPRRDEVIQLSKNPTISLPYSAEIVYSRILRSGEESEVIFNLVPLGEDNQKNQALNNLIIESELELPDTTISPTGHISQPLIKGKGLYA